MKPERWEEIEQLFHAALERPPVEREQFLAEACGGDEALGRQVAALLARDEEAENFIAKPAFEIAAKLLAADPLSEHPAAPALIGRYKTLALLGRGGMGEVHLAFDPDLQRKVAIKLLPARFTTDEGRVRRFAQEARAASALNHPNILTIHEIGANAGTHYIVTEYVEGETLRQRLTNAPDKQLQLNEALALAVQIAEALAAAHEAGIVHRDIKPENVMVRRDGYAKVLDFGLAKLTEPVSSAAENSVLTFAASSTEAGRVMGTPRYMSPEQARGEKVDARTDIFSLGIMLYEMLAGQTPFVGATPSEMIAAILRDEPQPLLECLTATSPELERIIRQTLRKDREERYQAANDLLADLRQLKKRLEYEADMNQAAKSSFHAQPEPDEASALPAKAASATTAQAQSLKPFVDRVPTPQKYLYGAGVIVLLLALASLGAYFWPVQKMPLKVASKKTLAVLPFVNGSQDASAEYLSDGISESVINNLSQLAGVKVMSRNSSFRFKNKQTDTRAIAAQLGVDALVTGDIQQIGHKLVINVHLIDATDDSQIWGNQYVKTSADILVTQSEIAQAVVQHLRLKLTNAEQQQLAKRYTQNTQAYELYLRGRYHQFKVTESEMRQALKFYQQAIDLDPGYALAYAGMADAYRTLPVAYGWPSKEAFPQAKAFAQRALALDPELAEAHIVLGWAGFSFDWDWSAAEKELKRAIEISPNNSDAHRAYAHFLSNVGRHDEAIAEGQLARELDPLVFINRALEGQFLFYAGRDDEALARLQKTIELAFDFWPAHVNLGRVYARQKRYPEAIAEFELAKRFSSGSNEPVTQLGYALAQSGDREKGFAALAELNARSARQYVPAYNFAMVYNGLRETNEAVRYLEKSFQQRELQITFLKIDSRWDNLRPDARFQGLFQRLHFPE